MIADMHQLLFGKLRVQVDGLSLVEDCSVCLIDFNKRRRQDLRPLATRQQKQRGIFTLSSKLREVIRENRSGVNDTGMAGEPSTAANRQNMPKIVIDSFIFLKILAN